LYVISNVISTRGSSFGRSLINYNYAIAITGNVITLNVTIRKLNITTTNVIIWITIV